MSEGKQGTASKNFVDHIGRKKYITTAISYTNGSPHIGHAYEFITADVITRYFRLYGYETFFLTGADEHGQKVAASAQAAGKSPQDHCNFFVDQFKGLDALLNISYDRYIRTTDDDHIVTAQKLWLMCINDIYLDKYVGWYNEREECFVADADAELAGYKDIGSGLPLKKVEEESYFFKMSAYCERLLAHIREYPRFIQPEQLRNHICTRLEAEGLKDLSISRTSFTWGIPVPNDERHVMYVWFDALTNYLSGVRALDDDDLKFFWPANFHIIGKDIVWFHSVIWPCMLMSAKLHLPECVFSHGFVNAADGRKMSKSYNNAIDPFEILRSYSADSVRYYVCSSVTYGSDINFSEENMITMHNSELADVLGNLVNRVLKLCQSYSNGVIPANSHDDSLGIPFDLNELRSDIEKDLETASINLAVFKAMESARRTNAFLQHAEPWSLKGKENENRRLSIVRTCLEAIYVVCHFLAPVLPMTTEEVFSRLNTPPRPVIYLKPDFYNLIPGTIVTVGNVLFQKIVADSQPVANTVEESDIKVDMEQPDFCKLDIRVGKIVKIWNHTLSEKLYCEEIDLGESSPRIVVSGIKAAYSIEELLNKMVIVLCNIKEAKVAGTLSFGLVLTAVKEGLVEIVEPPTACMPGDRVFISDYISKPLSSNMIKKHKVWETVKASLSTNENGEVSWKEHRLCTSSGPCRVKSLVNSLIS